MKRYIAAGFAVLTLGSHAWASGAVVDAAKIQKIIDGIPAKDGTFATRTSSLGITVKSITIHTVTKDEANGDPFSRAGDQAYSIETDAGSLDGDCQVLGSADFSKRGSLYIIESRTANWIMKGVCAAP